MVDRVYIRWVNVTLGKLMRSKRATRCVIFLEDTFQVIPALRDEAMWAYAFNRYHLISPRLSTTEAV